MKLLIMFAHLLVERP
uniref:Uncharacterized protein n=1 Tax=Rhizophora mucronata TaxID=61149 RepID=A0A2P2QKI8_RHIMU